MLQDKATVDVLVLELGGNDGLRGVDLTSTRENLTAIIDTTLAHSPKARILLATVPLPPNLGPEYTERFRDLYPQVAARYDRVTLLPLVPEGIGSVGPYMQSDGIHPNVAGHRYVAQNVWEELRPLLQRMRPVS
jgi:acyl-CoA thioesterase-1